MPRRASALILHISVCVIANRLGAKYAAHKRESNLQPTPQPSGRTLRTARGRRRPQGEPLVMNEGTDNEPRAFNVMNLMTLSLVAEHVRLHGGRVWSEDGVGGGTRFLVELPLQPDQLRPDPSGATSHNRDQSETSPPISKEGR